MKRFRARYAEELAKVEAELTDILVNIAEADFLAQYLGDQPEIQELRQHKADIEAKETRRQRLGQIIERLDQYTPQQRQINVPAPNQAGAAAKPPIKRY
jgi:hypothetical protein